MIQVTLKIALINLLSLKKKIFAYVGLKSINCLFAITQQISVPRVSKLVIRCIAALNILKLQESYKTLKSVFCIANDL